MFAVPKKITNDFYILKSSAVAAAFVSPKTLPAGHCLMGLFQQHSLSVSEVGSNEETCHTVDQNENIQRCDE